MKEKGRKQCCKEGRERERRKKEGKEGKMVGEERGSIGEAGWEREGEMGRVEGNGRRNREKEQGKSNYCKGISLR